MTIKELLPCPFCGQNPIILEEEKNEILYITLECYCGIGITRSGGRSYRDKIKRLIIDKWNTRVEEKK